MTRRKHPAVRAHTKNDLVAVTTSLIGGYGWPAHVTPSEPLCRALAEQLANAVSALAEHRKQDPSAMWAQHVIDAEIGRQNRTKKGPNPQ